jgi:hypothetical protein
MSLEKEHEISKREKILAFLMDTIKAGLSSMAF